MHCHARRRAIDAVLRWARSLRIWPNSSHARLAGGYPADGPCPPRRQLGSRWTDACARAATRTQPGPPALPGGEWVALDGLKSAPPILRTAVPVGQLEHAPWVHALTLTSVLVGTAAVGYHILREQSPPKPAQGGSSAREVS